MWLTSLRTLLRSTVTSPVTCCGRRSLSSCTQRHSSPSQPPLGVHYDGTEHTQTIMRLLTLRHQPSAPLVLPGSLHSVLHKKTIVDPLTTPADYRLPTYHVNITEKLTPGLIATVPKIDPHPLQRHIDEGSVKLPKVTMPYLIRIRKRKMKKHKLQKFRKRMIFLHRKLTEIKKRKKEKIMLEYQRSARQGAQDYSAEAFVDEKLSLARRGGYKVNILATRGRE